MKKRKILGINALNHDACVTLLHDNEIKFAGHSERYSGIKNDPLLNQEIISDVKRYGKWDKVELHSGRVLAYVAHK